MIPFRFRSTIRTGAILVWLLVCAGMGFGQTVQNIRGKVVDADTQTPLPGAKVVLVADSSTLGVLTDEVGGFRLVNIPVGRHSLTISYLGYETWQNKDLVLGAGKELVLEIGLTEKYVEAGTVEITDQKDPDESQNEMATVSARGFSVTETQRYAAALNDPGRMASTFAGVAASADGRNDIVIRGNSSAGMLWRLEGVDILNPNHFNNPGSSGGGISIIPTTMLANSDFLTGAFPSEYGNALSGVFDLNLRKGNNQQREFTFMIGVLGTSLAGEGPFSKQPEKGSYLFNYRYSTLDFLKALNIPNLQGSLPSYQDFGLHIDLPTRKLGRFGIFALGGLSKLNTEAEPDTNLWVYRSNRSQDIFGSDMGVAGIRHILLFKGGKSYLKTSLAVTANRNYYREDTVNTQFEPFRVNDERFVQGKFILHTAFNHKFNARHLLRAGVIGSRIFFQLRATTYVFPLQSQLQYLNAEGFTHLVQPYAQWRWRWNEQLTFTAGLHGMYLGLNKKAAIEPRAGWSWQASKRVSFGLGYGLHSQILPVGTYYATYYRADSSQYYPNQQLGFQHAHHAVISGNWHVSEDIRLKVESYYQRLFQVPIGYAGNETYSILNQQWGFATDSLFNGGTGRNMGLELTFEKFFSRNYYYMVTASLYDSRYTALDGVLRGTRFNGNYAVNVIAGKEFHMKPKERNGKTKLHYFELSGRIVWLGGQRYTPLDLALSAQAGTGVEDDTRPFTLQQKDYFRTDLRVAWHKDVRKLSHILSFDVQNVFNTQNNFSQRYDPTAQTVVQTYQAGLIPVLAYRLDF